MTAGHDSWTRFAVDPRPDHNAGLRASDSDRDVALDLLGAAYADGRLDREEYDGRAATVAAAKTLGDLVAPIRDLAPDHKSLVSADPQLLEAKAKDRYAQVRAAAWATFFGPSLVCWVIWAVAGFGFPWPIFVSLGTIARVGQVTVNRRAIIEEKKQEIVQEELRAIDRKPR